MVLRTALRPLYTVHYDCPQTSVLCTLYTRISHCLLFIRNCSFCGRATRLSNWLARLFNDLQNSLLFNRSFGPHFSVQTPFLTPKSPPQTTSWSSFFRPQLRYTIFLKNYTPPKRKPHFYMFCALKNISFLAPKSSQNRTFFKMPLKT